MSKTNNRFNLYLNDNEKAKIGRFKAEHPDFNVSGYLRTKIEQLYQEMNFEQSGED